MALLLLNWIFNGDRIHVFTYAVTNATVGRDKDEG